MPNIVFLIKMRYNRITNVLKGIDIKLAALIVSFLATTAFSLMASFLPLFVKTDLNYPLIEATYWTGVAQFIASSLCAITAPFWGSMCDRFGIKKITIILLATNTVVHAGMSASTNIAQILFFRGLQGSSGGYSTAIFTLVASIVTQNERKQALSYQIAMMTMGNLVGPGVGSLLASLFGYRFTLVAASLLFLSVIPLMFLINVPPSAMKTNEKQRFGLSDLRAIIPDFASLILVYACISFLVPSIPWFLKLLGISDEQLLNHTALTAILNGIAFFIAAPFLTRIITDRTLPLLSLVAAGVILTTAFVKDPYHFIALRVAVSAILAGIPPSLLGGGSTKKGTVMGFLNSARFLGLAVGPLLATSILGNGEPSKVLGMFMTMASLSFIASLVIYFTRERTQVNR